MEHQKELRLPPPNFSLPAKAVKNVSMEKKHLAACGLFASDSPFSTRCHASKPYDNFKQKNSKQLEQKPPQEFTSIQKDLKSYFCETCEMDLKSKEHLRRHRAEHTKCPVENCKHICHPDAMDKHVGTLHSTGVFEKVKKLSTPEEIAAWREERKRKFPTLANIQKQKEALEQKQRRGERLGENQAKFGRKEDRQRATAKEFPKKNNGKQNVQTNKKSKQISRRNDPKKPAPIQKAFEKKIPLIKEIVKEQQETRDSCCGIFMFKGTNLMPVYKHKRVKTDSEPNALLSLIGAYGSDGETDENSDLDETRPLPLEEELQQKAASPTVPSEPKASSSVCQPEENQMDSSDDPPIEQPIQRENSNKSTTEPPEKSQSEKTSVSISSPKQSRNDASDDEPTEQPIEREPSTAIDSGEQPSTSSGISNSTQPSQRPHSTRKYGLDYRKAARLRKQNTMLEKLLEPEIRHERNVLFQCVRFVCENDFFGIGKTTE